MFRFSIRDLLWLTVVVALGAAWLVQQHRLSEMRRWEFRAKTLGKLTEQGGRDVKWERNGFTVSESPDRGIDYLDNGEVMQWQAVE